MIADEQSQEEGKPTGKAAEEATPVKPEAKKDDKGEKKGSRKVIWLSLLCGLLFLLMLLFAWLWWQCYSGHGQQNRGAESGKEESKDKKESDAKEAEETKIAVEPRCTGTLRNYENRDLGFGFCYPTTWGDTSVHDARFDSSDRGSAWSISFSSKPQVVIGVLSRDWSTSVARDAHCGTIPMGYSFDFAAFSTAWRSEGSGADVYGAHRGIESMTDRYIIEENADDTLSAAACLNGYTIIDTPTYRHASAAYYAQLAGTIRTVRAHMDSPNTLIPTADRTAFADFVKSVYRL